MVRLQYIVAGTYITLYALALSAPGFVAAEENLTADEILKRSAAAYRATPWVASEAVFCTFTVSDNKTKTEEIFRCRIECDKIMDAIWCVIRREASFAGGKDVADKSPLLVAVEVKGDDLRYKTKEDGGWVRAPSTQAELAKAFDVCGTALATDGMGAVQGASVMLWKVGMVSPNDFGAFEVPRTVPARKARSYFSLENIKRIEDFKPGDGSVNPDRDFFQVLIKDSGHYVFRIDPKTYRFGTVVREDPHADGAPHRRWEISSFDSFDRESSRVKRSTASFDEVFK
jgi:hypothetical protein